MLGMYLSQLDAGVFREIMYIYETLIGGKVRGNDQESDPYRDAERFVQTVVILFNGRSNVAEFRFGSDFEGRWPHARLLVYDHSPQDDRGKTISFYFDPHLERKTAEAAEMIRRFESEIDYFLFSRGLAVFVETYEPRERLKKMAACIEQEKNDSKGSWVPAFIGEIKETRERLAAKRKKGEISEERQKVTLNRLKKLNDEIFRKQSSRMPFVGIIEIAEEEKKNFLLQLAIINEITGWDEKYL